MNADKQIALWATQIEPKLSVPREAEDFPAWRRKLRRGLKTLLHLPDSCYRNPQVKCIRSDRTKGLLVSRLKIKPAYSEAWEALLLEPEEKGEETPRNGRKGTQGKKLAWVCPHGCLEGGMASVTGLLDKSPGGRQALEQCEGDYGYRLAERGFRTLSFHFPGFGQRALSEGLLDGPATPNDKLFFHSLLLGKPYLGWCVADVITAVNALQNWPASHSVGTSRSDSWNDGKTAGVDRKDRGGRTAAGIGLVGFSMGGTLTAMTAAVYPKVKAVAVSGRFPSWLERLKDFSMTGLACVPGLLAMMEVDDILASIAPRPLFVSQEARGNLTKARRLLAEVPRVYNAYKASGSLIINYDNSPRHRFVGEPLYRWIETLSG